MATEKILLFSIGENSVVFRENEEKGYRKESRECMVISARKCANDTKSFGDLLNEISSSIN